MSSGRLKSWEVVSAREAFASPPWIRIVQQQVRLPNGKVVEPYNRIELPDFSVIFAETADGKVVVERQYKHGLGRVSLVLPAGCIEKDETPLEAAQRELLEETGYQSDHWQKLGSFVCHGNYGCGQAHFFRADRAELVAEPNSGDLEDMEIVLMTPVDLVNAVAAGEVGLLGSMAAIVLATHPLARRD